MNIVRATHQLAMDMSALAELSKAKGFHADAKDFFIKAFELEKKAAFMTSASDEDSVPHFILLRSAAALAFKSGLFQESERLIEICLAENPPTFIKDDLKEIQNLLSKTDKKGNLQKPIFDYEIAGVLTKVNAEENEITVKDDLQEQNYAILVPKDLLKGIIQQFWFQKVRIHVRQTYHGVMVLKHIKPAA